MNVSTIVRWLCRLNVFFLLSAVHQNHPSLAPKFLLVFHTIVSIAFKKDFGLIFAVIIRVVFICVLFSTLFIFNPAHRHLVLRTVFFPPKLISSFTRYLQHVCYSFHYIGFSLPDYLKKLLLSAEIIGCPLKHYSS